MDEFQEADILWPDTAPSQQEEDALFLFGPSETYELAASASSGASLFGPSEGFLSGAPSTAGASAGADHEEELQEADVLWPDTVRADEPRWGAGGFGWLRGDFARAGQQPAAATARLEELWPAVSSPIDIPAKAAARCR